MLHILLTRAVPPLAISERVLAHPSLSSKTCESLFCKPSPIRRSLQGMRYQHDVTHQTTHQHSTNEVLVPPTPSWSVSELRLTSLGNDDAHPEQISESELAILARRCLIDVRRLTPERRQQLRIDVAGIMRCASVLLDAKDLATEDDKDATTNQSTSTTRKDNQDIFETEVYDAPRGLGKLPIRKSLEDIIDEDACHNNSLSSRDDWALNDSKESKAVLQNESIDTKLVEEDGEKFFSVTAKRQ